MAGRFNGAVRYFFKGDQGLAKRYVGLAQKLIGNLTENMSGQRWYRTLPDGTTIDMLLTNGGIINCIISADDENALPGGIILVTPYDFKIDGVYDPDADSNAFVMWYRLFSGASNKFEMVRPVLANSVLQSGVIVSEDNSAQMIYWGAFADDGTGSAWNTNERFVAESYTDGAERYVVQYYDSGTSSVALPLNDSTYYHGEHGLSSLTNPSFRYSNPTHADPIVGSEDIEPQKMFFPGHIRVKQFNEVVKKGFRASSHQYDDYTLYSYDFSTEVSTPIVLSGRAEAESIFTATFGHAPVGQGTGFGFDPLWSPTGDKFVTMLDLQYVEKIPDDTSYQSDAERMRFVFEFSCDSLGENWAYEIINSKVISTNDLSGYDVSTNKSQISTWNNSCGPGVGQQNMAGTWSENWAHNSAFSNQNEGLKKWPLLAGYNKNGQTGIIYIDFIFPSFTGSSFTNATGVDNGGTPDQQTHYNYGNTVSIDHAIYYQAEGFDYFPNDLFFIRLEYNGTASTQKDQTYSDDGTYTCSVFNNDDLVLNIEVDNILFADAKNGIYITEHTQVRYDTADMMAHFTCNTFYYCRGEKTNITTNTVTSEVNLVFNHVCPATSTGLAFGSPLIHNFCHIGSGSTSVFENTQISEVSLFDDIADKVDNILDNMFSEASSLGDLLPDGSTYNDLTTKKIINKLFGGRRYVYSNAYVGTGAVYAHSLNYTGLGYLDTSVLFSAVVQTATATENGEDITVSTVRVQPPTAGYNSDRWPTQTFAFVNNEKVTTPNTKYNIPDANSISKIFTA